jgi:hypothetical protein
VVAAAFSASALASRSSSARSAADSPAAGVSFSISSQVLGFRRADAGLRGQYGQLVEDLPVAPVGALVVGQDLGQHRPGELVERLALPTRLEQLLLVGLTVHGDQVVGEVGEQRHRHGTAAGERA